MVKEPRVINPARVLLHPLWWGALLVLAINDHWLKGAGVLTPLATGKLSDFAGMIVTPALLAILFRVRSPRGFLLCHLALGGAFTALKLSPAVVDLFVAAGAVVGLDYRVVCDPTDLLALLLLPISARAFAPLLRGMVAQARSWRRLVAGSGLALGLLALLGTSASPPPRPALTPSAVYAIGASGGLKELDAKTGRALRTLPFEMTAHDVFVVGDGAIFRVDSEGGIRADDFASTARRWEIATLGTQHELFVQDRRLFERGESGLHVYDTRTGALLWRLPAATQVALWQSELLASAGQRPTFRNAVTGVALRRAVPATVDLSDNWWFAIEQPDGVFLAEMSSFWGGRSLVALDSSTFARLWERSAPGEYVATSERVVVADRGDLLALDARTGALRWQTESSSGDVLAASDALVITQSWNELAAFDPASGRKLWRTDLDH